MIDVCKDFRILTPLLVTALFGQAPEILAPTGVVVAIESDPALIERASSVKDLNSALDASVVSTLELKRRLTGIMSPRDVDLEVTRQHVALADDLELHFDSEAADKWRQDVLRDFDASVMPSVELATLAARALHSLTATAVYAGKLGEARSYARQALMRFSHLPPDLARLRPDVANVFRQAGRDVQQIPLTQVTFMSTMPGHVFVNGNDLGLASPQLVVNLRQGNIKAWVATDTATSLAHAFVVASQPVNAAIDFQLESGLTFQSIPTLRCAPACDVALQRLAKAARVDQAIGLTLVGNGENAQGLYVKADDGTSDTRIIAALAAPPRLFQSDQYTLQQPPSTTLSPLLFVPVVAQLSQGRYVAGSIVAGATAGCVGWNIASALKLRNSEADGDRAHSLRTQQNVSAVALVGVLVIGVAEALIWHANNPESPNGETQGNSP